MINQPFQVVAFVSERSIMIMQSCPERGSSGIRPGCVNQGLGIAVNSAGSGLGADTPDKDGQLPSGALPGQLLDFGC